MVYIIRPTWEKDMIGDPKKGFLKECDYEVLRVGSTTVEFDLNDLKTQIKNHTQAELMSSCRKLTGAQYLKRHGNEGKSFRITPVGQDIYEGYVAGTLKHTPPRSLQRRGVRSY